MRHEAGQTDGRAGGQCDYYLPPKVPLRAYTVPLFLKVYHFSISQHFPNVKMYLMQAVVA